MLCNLNYQAKVQAANKDLSNSNSFYKDFRFIVKLKLSGDVESHPEPTYDIEKVIMASFYQGLD